MSENFFEEMLNKWFNNQAHDAAPFMTDEKLPKNKKKIQNKPKVNANDNVYTDLANELEKAERGLSNLTGVMAKKEFDLFVENLTDAYDDFTFEAGYVFDQTKQFVKETNKKNVAAVNRFFNSLPDAEFFEKVGKDIKDAVTSVRDNYFQSEQNQFTHKHENLKKELAKIQEAFSNNGHNSTERSKDEHKPSSTDNVVIHKDEDLAKEFAKAEKAFSNVNGDSAYPDENAHQFPIPHDIKNPLAEQKSNKSEVFVPKYKKPVDINNADLSSFPKLEAFLSNNKDLSWDSLKAMGEDLYRHGVRADKQSLKPSDFASAEKYFEYQLFSK